MATGSMKGFALGREGAGIVRRIGSEVKKFQVGDRVIFSKPDAFSTTVNVPETLCAAIPGHLSLTDASTLPLAFAIAIHSLINIGQLEKGQV
jgi:NADPH:quinone reductase-like Zn-dependent oxidoreductase